MLLPLNSLTSINLASLSVASFILRLYFTFTVKPLHAQEILRGPISVSRLRFANSGVKQDNHKTKPTALPEASEGVRVTCCLGLKSQQHRVVLLHLHILGWHRDSLHCT